MVQAVYSTRSRAGFCPFSVQSTVPARTLRLEVHRGVHRRLRAREGVGGPTKLRQRQQRLDAHARNRRASGSVERRRPLIVRAASCASGEQLRRTQAAGTESGGAPSSAPRGSFRSLARPSCLLAPSLEQPDRLRCVRAPRRTRSHSPVVLLEDVRYGGVRLRCRRDGGTDAGSDKLKLSLVLPHEVRNTAGVFGRGLRRVAGYLQEPGCRAGQHCGDERRHGHPREPRPQHRVAETGRARGDRVVGRPVEEVVRCATRARRARV